MRFLATFLTVFLAGCPIGAIESNAAPGDDTDPNIKGSCEFDQDCVTAGATCCECPTFAVNRNDPVHRACAGVECGPPASCAENVTAICNADQQCELKCAPLAVANVECAMGYALDMNGCLTDACAVPVAGGCSTNGECTRTRADCCGCDQGGFDTAVRASDQAMYDAMLECPAQPQCPGVSTCNSDTPQCLQGRCELLPANLPPGACGRPDLPKCPTDQACVVNLSDPANLQGVGICAPPP